jgi:signal peptidase II
MQRHVAARNDRKRKRRVKLILLLSLPLYALDQLTKWWVIHSLDPEIARPVIANFFHLVYVTNTGAAFGSFKNNNLFFIALSVVALIFVVSLLLRPHPRDQWRDISLALLLAGILGNVTDRLLHGHVIDFLLFDFGEHAPRFLHPWPAFNVADSCICIAVFCFIVHAFQRPHAAASAVETETNT